MRFRFSHFLPGCVLAFCLLRVLPPLHCSAASLVLDENFRAPSFGRTNPAGQSFLLPDGKFLLFGKAESLAAQRTGPLIKFLADGTLDPSFNFSPEYSSVAAVTALSNGQLIVSATQTAYGSASTEQILRINGDGSVDPTFANPTVETRTYATVQKIVEQSDGKILIVGFFDNFAGLPKQKIVRLLANGSIDGGFNPPPFTGGFGIWARPVLLGGGKMLVGGDFTALDGNASLGLARLNSDGTLDSTFQTSGFNRGGIPIRAIVFQSDGKIVMGGRFQLSFPTRRVPLFRLNANGSADTSFVCPIQTTAYDLVVRPNDKLLTAVSGTSVGAVYQFSADGTIDSSFHVPGFVNNTSTQFAAGTPNSIGLLVDGRAVIGGTFSAVTGGTVYQRFGVARFNTDGTLDTTLGEVPKTGYPAYPQSFIRLPDQSTLAAFEAEVEPATPSNLARFLADGSLDSAFQLTSSDPNSIVASGFVALTLTPLADARLFISGRPPDGFLRIGKFLNDGNEDLGFASGYEAFRSAIALSDGKVLLSAGSDPQNTLTGILTRRQASGVPDSGFSLDPQITAAQIVRDAGTGILLAMHVGSRVLAVQPDGKALFAYLSRVDEKVHLVRLTTFGSIDATFSETILAPAELTFGFPVVYDPYTNMTLQPSGGVYQAVSPFADAHVLSDGRILLVGRFLTFAGTAARGMIRLLEDGTVDPTFSAGGGAQWTATTETSTFFPGIEKIAEEVGGDFLIAGTFEAFNGTPLPGIARVHPDGSADPGFIPVANRLKLASGTAQLERQPDGSFFLSGPYAFPKETQPALIHINSLGGIPVIGSAAITAVRVGQTFSYQIVASGQPTSYQATGLPAGFSVNTATGVITGSPAANQVGNYQIALTATNATGTSAPYTLALRVADTLQVSSVVSRKAHGSAGSFDVDLPLTGEPGVECRSSSGQRTLVFTFNNDVVRAQGSLIKGQASFSGEPIIDGNTVSATIYNVADQQQLTFNVTGLTDVYGQTMPDVVVSMNILIGDTNGNKAVNVGDIAQTKGQSGLLVTEANFRADVNASGTVNVADIGQVKANAGHTLP